MRLFIIRHGDPDYAHDSLTEKGLREAEALAEWFADVRLDEIFASPLGRAQMTAAPTAAQKGMEVKILPFTAESMDYMASFSAQDDIGYTYSVKVGVSDYRDGSGRFEERSATLAEMIKGSDEFLAGYGMERRGGIYRAFGTCEKRVAVFCHGGFGAAWIGHLLGMAPLRAFRQLDITTTGVTVFDFIPEADGFVTPRMVAFSGAAHLYNAGLRQKP